MGRPKYTSATECMKLKREQVFYFLLIKTGFSLHILYICIINKGVFFSLKVVNNENRERGVGGKSSVLVSDRSD